MKHMKHVIDNGTEIEVVVRHRRDGKNVGLRTSSLFGTPEKMGSKKRKQVASKITALSEQVFEYLTATTPPPKEKTEDPSKGVEIDIKPKKAVQVLLDPALDSKWEALGEETAKLTGRNKVRVVRGTIRERRFYPEPQGSDVVVQGVQGAVLNSWRGVVKEEQRMLSEAS